VYLAGFSDSGADMFAFWKNWKRAVASLCLLVIVAATLVWWLYPRQTLPGRLVDYHKIYEPFWDVACDTALDGSDRRCYLQYVDVYRPRPDFAAAMVEVVYHAGEDGTPDPHVRFDIEPGLSFRDTGLVVETSDGEVPLDVSDCRSNTCVITGDAGRDMLEAWRDGTSLWMEISDGGDESVRLAWPLDEMATILEDLAAQRKARNLP